MAQQELFFIAFLIVPLTESSNNGQKLSGETQFFSKDGLLALERREVRYPIGLLNFLEDDPLTVLLSLPLLLLSTSASSAISNSKFPADLVMELVLFPTLASSTMSNGEFLADRNGVLLSIEVSGLANLLKP